MYSFMVVNYKDKLRANKQWLEKILSELFKQSFDEGKRFRQKKVAIRSHGYQVGVYEWNKIGISPKEAKYWIPKNGITTRAHGHYLILLKKVAVLNTFIEEFLFAVK